MKTKIKRLELLINSNNPEAFAYLEKIVQEVADEQDLKTVNALAEHLISSASASLNQIENEYKTIQQQMGVLSDAINLAYIARNYFGKSRSWLYQRLNGYSVNGKRAEFSEDEKRIFLNALDDIKTQIGAISATL